MKLFEKFKNLWNKPDTKEYEKALEKTLQKRIELRIIVDESLIGGFKVYLKNDVYDASILRKVHNLKKKLLNIKEENYEY